MVSSTDDRPIAHDVQLPNPMIEGLFGWSLDREREIGDGMALLTSTILGTTIDEFCGGLDPEVFVSSG